VTPVSATAELAVLSIDTKRITHSNSANEAIARRMSACVVSIAGLGYCKFMVPDGDFVVGEQVLRSTGGGNWKGIAGGAEFVQRKPIVTGTGQGCARASGTYELSRSCGTRGHHS
jgi:hypothetical protein